jgi:NAD(P)-dependent dehydrogenase (short-subunit alcohol dehydrogenase family)
MEFLGKVAMITSGAIGFGRAFGFVLGQRGSRIAIVDTNVNGSGVRRLNSLSGGIEAIGTSCDVGNCRRSTAQ